MSELFLELISEQIPARFQKFGAQTLTREFQKIFSSLHPKLIKEISNPRRIGCVFEIDSEIPAKNVLVKGPKISAPEQAIQGFARKYNLSPENLKQENGVFFFEENVPARTAEAILQAELPELLWSFPWPKAMRWGGGSRFAWVRPLHRIVCLLNGKKISFSLAREGDEAHGLISGTHSEDGPFSSEEKFEVSSATQWEAHLRAKKIIPFHEERLELLKQSLCQAAADKNLEISLPEALLNEVTGLCEIPKAYIGKIDPKYMVLPLEVREDVMESHQRYFPLFKAGKPAPFFAFAANHPFDDQESVIHGNERVLRARLEDARHFWDQDRKRPLASRVDDLEKMTFQEGLGTQKERALRLEKLSEQVAQTLGFDEKQQKQAKRAGLLLKADLVTEMVGELPALQGIMGGYYAEHDGEDADICQAVRQHYFPKGNAGEVPESPVSIAAALADRIDTLVNFFSIGLVPTGSGDPFGLRRVALGIFKILQHNRLPVDLGALLALACEGALPEKLEDFLIDRLRVQLRQEQIDADIAEAVLNLRNADLDKQSLFKKLDGKIISEIFDRASFLQTLEQQLPTWPGLLNAYRRAGNILQAEIKKGWKPSGAIEETLLKHPSEKDLAEALKKQTPPLKEALKQRQFKDAFVPLSQIQPEIDAFFENVLVNDPDEALRHNRLLLISEFCSLCDKVADFSKVEKKANISPPFF